MKKTTKEKMMILCVGALVIILGSIIVRFGTMQVFVKTLHMKDGMIPVILGDNEDLMAYKEKEDGNHIDWVARYPFQGKEEAFSTDTFIKKSIGRISSLKGKIESFEQKSGNWTNQYLWHYMDIVQLADACKENVLCWNIQAQKEYNGVVKLSDGQLVSLTSKKEVSENVMSLTDFSRECQEYGIHFVMVLAPSKIGRSEMPYDGKLDFSNQNADKFVSGLRDNNVEYIDIRDCIIEEGLSQHDLFYRTDHHWKASTARWATGKIFSYLNQMCGYQADKSLLEPDQFDEKVYPSWFLGSKGKKLTLARTTPDDFSLFYPKFATSFDMYIPSMNLKKQGDFSIMYDMESMDISKGYYKVNPYATYAYGDRALIDIHNKKKNDGKHLLLIHDSFGDSVTPFLALGMEHLQTVDLRRFTGSLRSLIEEEQPDTVVVLYYAEELGGRLDMKQHTGLFDFR